MNMHKKYITSSQRIIAYVLLFSQLLTSCGLNEKIPPIDEKGTDTQPASSSRLTKEARKSTAVSAVKALNVPPIIPTAAGRGLQLDQDEKALSKSMNDSSNIAAYFKAVQLKHSKAALQLQDANQRLYEITKKGKTCIANVYTQDGYQLYQSLPVVAVGKQELMQTLLQYPTFPKARIQLTRDKEGFQVYIGFQGLKGGMLRNWSRSGHVSISDHSSRASYSQLSATDEDSSMEESRSHDIEESRSHDMEEFHSHDIEESRSHDMEESRSHDMEESRSHDIEDPSYIEDILESPKIAVKRELALHWLVLDTLFDVLQIGVTAAKQGLIDTLLFKYGVLSFVNLVMACKDLLEDLYTESKYHYYSGNTCFSSNANASTPPTIPVTSTSLQKFQDHTWYGESFAKTHGKVQWIVMPTSDGGVLPGSRNTAYTDQVKYMQQTHPPFSVLKGRELAVAVIGSALVNPDHRLLFDRPGDGKNQGKGWGEARCEELWSATGSSSSLRLSMGKFNQAGLQVTKSDNNAYTDCGLASGVKFSKTTANTSFTMDSAALIKALKSRLATANIDYHRVVEISKANFRDFEKNDKLDPALVASYKTAYEIFLTLFHTHADGKYKRMLQEVVQAFREHNESRFDINDPAGIGLYQHLVFQVLAHLLQSDEVPDNSIAIFFRTPKDINLRIWISLVALAEICEKVPEDPSKKIDETTWKQLTATAEDKAWLKVYLAKYQGNSATIGVNKEGKVFLNSNLNPCNDTDYTRLEEDEEIEKLILFKQSLRQYIAQDLSLDDDEHDVKKKLIHHALLHPAVCYKHIKQYMYFSSTIYDKLPDDFKVGMWHHQHHYMDAISRKEASGRYAIDTGGVTRTNVDAGETEIPRFSIIWK